MEQLLSMLQSHQLTITTAESCTGGLLAGAITDVSGASDCFHRGVVTYANEAKMELLGVSQNTLKQYGAVSPQTATEMAEGALKTSGADIALSVTGIAGPGGGTAEKPVGLVYIGVAGHFGTIAVKNQFGGSRQEVRRQAVEKAIWLAKDYLTEHYNSL